jgi:cytochrome P450
MRNCQCNRCSFDSEDVWVAGYLFPKDTNVMANISYIHYNPELWPDPEKFDPTRFLDDSGHFVPPKIGYLPFSVGKRFCLGQSLVEKEFFIFFSGILQKFEFRGQKNAALPNISFHEDDLNMGFVRQPTKFFVDMKLRK